MLKTKKRDPGQTSHSQKFSTKPKYMSEFGTKKCKKQNR